MSEWRARATIPKDGTWVLAFCAGAIVPVALRWDGKHWDDGEDIPGAYQPTHWMPLPEPPNA